MRVVHLFPEINKGGTERIVLSLAQKQSLLHEVSIIVFNDKNLYPTLTRNLNIIYITESTFVEYSLFRIKKKSTERLESILKSLSPDIIHSHSFWTDTLLLSIPKFNSSYISHLHLYYDVLDTSCFSLRKEYFTNWLDKKRFIRLYKKYQFSFITISKDINRKFKKSTSKQFNKVTNLIPNAIQLPNYHSPKESINLNKITFLNVSRLEHVKNQNLLVEVAFKLKSLGYSFVMKIAGEGNLKQELHSKIQKYQLDNEVLLLGNIDNIEDEYLNSDIYLHSSLNETFGLTIIEALSHNLPCVCVKAGGNEDIITPFFNGFMSNNDVDEFVGYILQIIDNQDVYQTLVNNAYESVKKYDINSYNNKIDLLYQSLIHR